VRRNNTFLISLVAASMLCAVSPARAESPAKIPRIGFLTNGTEASPVLRKNSIPGIRTEY
jgi:hypothetical protein